MHLSDNYGMNTLFMSYHNQLHTTFLTIYPLLLFVKQRELYLIYVISLQSYDMLERERACIVFVIM